MTQYILSNIADLEAAFADPDTPLADVGFRKVNDVVIDWVANGGSLTIPLTIGSVILYEKPFSDPPNTYPVFDDGGSNEGFPPDGQSAIAGTFTCTLWDGVNETAQVPVSVPITGVASTPPPAQVTNTLAPVISGNTPVGSTLTTTDGTWTGTGTITFAYQWQADGANISGATSSTYVTQAGDAGKAITCDVTATDDNGSASATSNTITVDAAGTTDLANLSLPGITGTPTQGQTLSGSNGTWEGEGTISFAYLWLRNGSAIAGATSSTYVLQAADVGTNVSFRVTATDSLTSLAATSASVTVAAAGTVNFDVMKQELMNEFATSPDKGWSGFTDETGFTIYTETTPQGVVSRISTWANGSPATSKVKIICDWDGVLNASTTRILAVKTAKLNANASKPYGVDLPVGGIWLEAASGKRPIWGSRLELTGMPRIHINGVHFAGQLGGLNATSTFCLKYTRTSFYPLTGCIYHENMSIGQLDNRGSFTFADVCKGLNVQGGYSYRHHNVRFAGTRNAQQIHCHYIWREFTDAQGHLGDFRFTTDPGSLSGGLVYAYDNMALVRDCRQEVTATGLHTDTNQFGTSADGHGGYFGVFENQLTHIKSSVANDSGSQGYYNDDYTSGKFEVALQNVVAAYGGYHGVAIWDPSQAGRYIGNRCLFLRAGDVNSNGQDSFQQINVVHGVANGGIRKYDNCVFTRSNGNTAALQLSNTTYVSSLKGVVSGDGSTEAQALRIEDFITGTVSRDGTDFMTYTIPNEDSTVTATAWQALQDFYEPQAGGWAGKGVTWPAWSVPAVN